MSLKGKTIFVTGTLPHCLISKGQAGVDECSCFHSCSKVALSFYSDLKGALMVLGSTQQRDWQKKERQSSYMAGQLLAVS